VSDLLSRGREFSSRSGCYQVVTTVCEQVNCPGITNTKMYSAFHPSEVGKLSNNLTDWG